MSRVVVVGNGMAGSRFVQELLERDTAGAFEITVVGEEDGGTYNRVLLSNVLAGATRPDAITMVTPSWYAERDVALRSGRVVTTLDRTAQTVALDDGTVLSYDTLVLATGSAPVLPPIAGLCRPDGALLDGAALFRTRDDCASIAAWAADAQRAVVVGAGLLGLEAARALAGRGLQVTVVQREDRLMERQLDATAGRVLGRILRDLGIEVRAGVTVAGVHGADRVSGVTLSDGRVVSADIVVLCCGVQPRADLARKSGLRVGRGVVVDDRLVTSDPHVLAVGECAEHRDRVYGLVAPVWEQARVAAAVLADSSCSTRYAGSSTITRLKAAGIELATMGEQSPSDEPEDDSDATEFVTFVDRTRRVYQKLVVSDGRLIAAILVGDTRNAGTVTQLFERNAVLPPDRAALLVPRRSSAPAVLDSPTALPGRATICQCNGVTKADITAAWQQGARSVDEIAARTRATTGCGTCRDAVCGLTDWLAQSDSGAELTA